MKGKQFTSAIAEDALNFSVVKTTAKEAPAQKTPEKNEKTEPVKKKATERTESVKKNEVVKTEEKPASTVKKNEPQEDVQNYINAALLKLIPQKMSSLKQQSVFLSPSETAAVERIAKDSGMNKYIIVRMLLEYGLEHLYPGVLDAPETHEEAEKIQEDMTARRKSKYGIE